MLITIRSFNKSSIIHITPDTSIHDIMNRCYENRPESKKAILKDEFIQNNVLVSNHQPLDLTLNAQHYGFSNNTIIELISNCPLDWKNRLDNLMKILNSTFKLLSQHKNSSWGHFNGDNDYCMNNISQVDFMKKIICENYPQRKKFYFTDLGAGNFSSINYMSQEIEKDDSLPDDIEVHCIGVRGEYSAEEEITTTKRCILYKFGAFKIECLLESFAEKGLDLRNKIDLGVSRWSLRHLTDPLGTFLQFYCLIGMGGFIQADGWHFGIPDLLNGKHFAGVGNSLMLWILLQSQEPFVMTHWDQMRSYNHFILQKTKLEELSLPLFYKHIERHNVCGSECVTFFDLNPLNKNELIAKGLPSYYRDYEQFKHKTPRRTTQHIGDLNLLQYMYGDNLEIVKKRQFNKQLPTISEINPSTLSVFTSPSINVVPNETTDTETTLIPRHRVESHDYLKKT